jgi:parvulin-like peptidyl-prolyl isomerase
MKIAVTIESNSAHHPKVPRSIIGLVVFLFTISFALSEDRIINDTLAIIGDKVITLNRFGELFREKLITIGLTDNSSTRLGYLLNLVDDEILINHARQEKFGRTSEAADKKRSIEIQELLDAYSEKHFTRQSKVTENDLRDLFIKMNKKIKVSHLYAKTKIGADSLFHELSQGRSFEELAKQTFTDPKLKERGGSLGYISIDEMDPAFERAAYEMHIGEISRPVKTVQGYSIIRVDDIKGNPFVTESEYAKAREKLRGFAKRRKYEEMVRLFTSDLRSKLNIRFNTIWMNKLYGLSQENSFKYSVENKSFALSPRDLHKTIVTSTTGKWNIQELIQVLSQTSERQRAWIHTEENFEDFVAGLVLQRYLIQEAKKEKLDTTPSFRNKVNDAFDTYLLSTLENQMKNRIAISTDSLHSYYTNHLNDFKTLEEIRLSAILVDNASKSDLIKQLLEQGVPFSELAKQYSLQTFTAEQGGDLGFYRRKDLGDLGGKIFPLRPGEWRGPLIENEKYLFVKCTERKDAVQRPFEESKKEIEDFLVSMTWIKSRHQEAESLKKKIACRVFPEKLRTMTLH